MEIVLVIGEAGVDCIRVPGWSALGVAALLTAPRLVSQWIDGKSG